MIRFADKIAFSPHPEDCWHWLAATGEDGYGRFHVGSRTDGSTRMVLAHRLAYELFVGPIPRGLTLDHVCRNRGCVNPGHVEPVTLAENTRRGRSGVINGQRMKAKTHCNYGHEFTPENTRYERQGRKRVCRTCSLARDRRRREVSQ